MSDTPRTDEQVIQFGDGPAQYVYAAFAGQLEREIRQLEVAIYDLKTENNLLHEALDQVIEDRDSYHDENAELLKYKERMEWLLATFDVVELVKDKERLDWLLENKYALSPEQDLSHCKHTCAESYQLIYTRKNIDKAMEESQ